MATITPTAGTNAGAVIADGNTAAGGDEFVFANKPLFIDFFNGHSSSITIAIAAVTATKRVDGAGTVTVPARSLVLAAGEKGGFAFTQDNAGAYVNASGRIAVAYTGHNAALKQRAIVVG